MHSRKRCRVYMKELRKFSIEDQGLALAELGTHLKQCFVDVPKTDTGAKEALALTVG